MNLPLSNDGPAWFQVSVVPARTAYLIRAGSRTGFRRAMQEATTRWAGMTEPIIPVRRHGGIDGWWRQVVEFSGVGSVVNVDVLAEDAHAAAKLLNLPLVSLADIDRHGPASWSMHPLMLDDDTADFAPVLAGSGSPLWHAVAAGDFTSAHERSLRSSEVEFARLETDAQVASSALRRSTMIDRTTVQFSENYANGGIGSIPAIIWVTRPNGYLDCLWFWNLRALRPLRFDAGPMMILPVEGASGWAGFDREFSAQLLRRDDFSPDVIFMSINVTESKIIELANFLQLEPSGEKIRSSIFWSGSPRVAPYSYLINPSIDIRDWFAYERRYGQSVEVQGHTSSGLSALRLAPPVKSKFGGKALLCLRSSIFDVFPRRTVVAESIVAGADWDGDSLRIRTKIVGQSKLNLKIPDLGVALDLMVREKTSSYALSDKGKLGSPLLGDSPFMLNAGVYEAAISLTTPRSSELVKQLRAMRERGDGDEQLVELAARWGGRAERRYRSIGDIGKPNGQVAIRALELLCDKGWAERGLEIRCSRCGVSSFIALEAAFGKAVCPGCKDHQSYVSSRSGVNVFYRLNTFLDRASDQGVLPHLLTYAALLKTDPITFLLPGVDVVFPGGDKSEVDIVAIYSGKLLAGEVKTSPSEFNDEQIKRDVSCSKRLGADVHLMASVWDLSQDVREVAKVEADAAGMDLLVLDQSQLRPT
ncbi:hypothetical protein [Umezawaea tangerina]|uniref:Uncharacterized protein n=1 Tax=Umezawaea tangerina TaxID=84725 RepID=A0A2T0TLQ9_9PSEU|nr:hypothetical protein [Umezawaea tangerina]PRY46551.1 hypothetical protein CLV43_101827 [Umezawaea tangerina]